MSILGDMSVVTAVVLVLAWTFCGVVEASPHRHIYGVMIDAGSSGSRVRVYRWATASTAPSAPRCCALPNISEVDNLQIKPGISAYAHDLSGLETHVNTLLDMARETVPRHHHRHTSIYVFSTAGMRLLLESAATTVIQRIDALLHNSSFSPFRYSSRNTRILSGEEEGIFAWIAVNYLRGFFSAPEGSMSSVGVLEMGGASTQITFIPTSGNILANKFSFRMGGRIFSPYVHSFLYYGQEYAFRWVQEYLHKQNPSATSLENPCMLTGDATNATMSGVVIHYTGSGDPAECEVIMEAYVYKVDPTRCHPKPCSMGSIYQPSIKETKTFYAVSAFLYTLKAIEALDLGFTPMGARHSARNYCIKHIDEAARITPYPRQYLSHYCTMGIYIPTLLTKAYGFQEDTDQIIVATEIHGQAIEWTIGAILYEHQRAAFPCTNSANKNQFSTSVILFISTFTYVTSLILKHCSYNQHVTL